MGKFSSNKASALIVSALAQFVAGAAHAQSCPSSINITERLQGSMSGWIAVEAQSSRYLTGVNIIEGELHQDAGDNALLKPTVGQEGESMWKFSKAIGDSEAWVQCIYEGSSIVLSKRIEPQVQKCSANWIASTGSRKKRLQASCQ